MKKRIVSVVLVAALAVTSCVNGYENQASAAKKSIKLNKSAKTIEVGENYKVNVLNGQKKAKVSWKISDKAVLKLVKKSVKGNKAYASVKGLKEGKANVTATYTLGKTKKKLTCKVKVVEKEIIQENDSTAVPNIPVATSTTAPSVTKPPIPTKAPTAEPTAEATAEPTKAPTAEPTKAPTAEPTKAPTAAPTAEPTEAPTAEPTKAPTAEPTKAPTPKPTRRPVVVPTVRPIEEPTEAPEEAPTAEPTKEPVVEEPTAVPTPSVIAGRITLSENTWWDTLLSVITFGLYDKEVTLTIDSNIDNSSVYYYVVNDGSTTALTKEELVSLGEDEWTPYSDSVVLAEEYNVVYAKIVDNVTTDTYYISSDGIQIKENKEKLDVSKISGVNAESEVQNADGTKTFNKVDLVLIPLKEAYEVGTKVKVKVYGEAEGSRPRIWLSKGAWDSCSNQVKPYVFETEEILTVSAAGADSLQVKALSYGEKFSSITIKEAYISVVSDEPVVEPTAAPTQAPTAEPTAEPTEEPVVEEPTEAPTEEPTAEPTEAPTEEPVVEEPTEEPVVEEPTEAPTEEPTAEPTEAPTAEPTAEPTVAPPTEKPLEYNMPLSADTIKTDWGSEAVFNEDGSVTVTIKGQYGGFEFVLPENEQDNYAEYEIGYTDGNGQLASDYKYVGDTDGRDIIWGGLLNGTGTWGRTLSLDNKLQSVHIFSATDKVTYPVTFTINSFKCYRLGEPASDSIKLDLSKFVANGTASQPVLNEDGSLSIEYASSYNGSAIELPGRYDLSDYKYVEISIESTKASDGKDAGNQFNFIGKGADKAFTTKYMAKGIMSIIIPDDVTLGKININPQDGSDANHELTKINYIKLSKVANIDLTQYIPGWGGFGTGESLAENEDGTVTLTKTRNYDCSGYDVPEELQECSTVMVRLSTTGGDSGDGNSRVRILDTDGKELTASYIGGWNHANAEISYSVPEGVKIGKVIVETQGASEDTPTLQTINYIKIIK